MNLGKDELIAGFERAGLRNRRCIVHASLRSLGHVDGGADTVAQALAEIATTVLVPTFTYAPAAIPPRDDRPTNNGCDYDTDRLGDAHPTPFTLDMPVARDIGAVADAVRKLSGAIRSDHPLSSIAAVRDNAASYVANQSWDEPMAPIARMADDDGEVVHIGTDYTSCTTAHYGEIRAGRRTFIRWAMVADGSVQRVRVGGCSAGFNALAPYIRELCETKIGNAVVRRIAMQEVIRATRAAIAENPMSLACSPTCARCRDAANGGPD